MSITCRKETFGACLLICSWLFIGLALAEDAECPGPINFYKEVGCKPIYKNPGDKCASQYDCSHLKHRSADKCYVNGHNYAIGQNLRDVDRAYPCNLGCHCVWNERNNISKFMCAIVDCFPPTPEPGCFLVAPLHTCCSREIRCPKTPEDRAKCEVDGKTYLEGELFKPKNTDLVCLCTPEYEGKPKAAYCRKSKCGLEIRNPFEIRENCAPVYGEESPATSCPFYFRCQRPEDVVVPPTKAPTPGNNQKVCKYGNLRLNIGEELSESNYYTGQCTECVCEVPPTLTCRRLSAEQCQIKYPKSA